MRSAAHTYIFFTSTARTDLHDVHNRFIAAAFFTDHGDIPFHRSQNISA
jgi:hypothetical protein